VAARARAHTHAQDRGVTHSREYERNAGMRDADESVPAEIARGRESNFHANTATHRAAGAGDSRLKRSRSRSRSVLFPGSFVRHRRRRDDDDERPLNGGLFIIRISPRLPVSRIDHPRWVHWGPALPVYRRYRVSFISATAVTRRCSFGGDDDRQLISAGKTLVVARARGCGMPAALT